MSAAIALTLVFLVNAAPASAMISPSPESSAWCTTFTGDGSGGVLEGWTGLTPNLPVCGPSPEFSGAADADTAVRLPEAYGRSFWGGTLSGFQCVELADRWLAMAYGLDTLSSTNGDRVAANYYNAYHASHPQMRLIGSGTSGEYPEPGDVISFSDSSSFYDSDGGHVAVVVPGGSVNSAGNGTIYVAQENVGGGLSFTHQALSVSHWQVNGEGYSYVEWLQASNPAPPGNGSFVSYSGKTYRIVGDYPLPVTNCAALTGGCGSPTPVSSLSSYRSTIANGTALYETDDSTGGVFSALGGTIVAVSSCSGKDAPVCSGMLQVNYDSIVAYVAQHPTIANGTAIVELDQGTGAVFSAIGGTIVHVTSCSGKDAPVCANEVQEPYDTIADYVAKHPTIANGTAIVELDQGTGAIYSAVGGTIVHVTSCSGVDAPVCANDVQEPYDTIADYVAQHPTIATGTVLHYLDHGQGYLIVEGQSLESTSCAQSSCKHAAVLLPFASIEAYAQQHQPSTGTTGKTGTGTTGTGTTGKTGTGKTGTGTTEHKKHKKHKRKHRKHKREKHHKRARKHKKHAR